MYVWLQVSITTTAIAIAIAIATLLLLLLHIYSVLYVLKVGKCIHNSLLFFFTSRRSTQHECLLKRPHIDTLTHCNLLMFRVDAPPVLMLAPRSTFLVPHPHPHPHHPRPHPGPGLGGLGLPALWTPDCS